MRFDDFTYEHRPALMNYVRKMVGSRAEDVVQETFVRAWRAPFTSLENPKAWCYLVAKNLAINEIKRRDNCVVELPDDLIAAHDVPDQVINMIDARAALAAVSSLPPAQRTALAFSAAGKSHRETSLALGITEGNARQLTHRARTRVRELCAA